MPARRRPARKPARKPMRKMRSKRGGKLAVPAAMRTSPDQFASVTETFQYNDSLPNIAYGRVFSLGDFARASRIASNYKWYKAAKVTYTYTPLYNTFQNEVGATISKPQLYFKMNRSQDALPVNLGSIQACGAKPQQFTSNKTISYVPNWCSPGLIAENRNTVTGDIFEIFQMGLQAQTAWLPTSGTKNYENGDLITPVTAPGLINLGVRNTYVWPSRVLYNGHVDYIYQENSTEPVYSLVITVKWMFKQPNFEPFTTPPPREEESVVNNL